MRTSSNNKDREAGRQQWEDRAATVQYITVLHGLLPAAAAAGDEQAAGDAAGSGLVPQQHGHALIYYYM